MLWPRHSPPPEAVGDRIRRLRRALGMEQKDLAEAVGVDRVAVGNWEISKHTPGTERIPAIADALNVTADYLLNGDAGRYQAACREIATVVNRYGLIPPAGEIPGSDPADVVKERLRRPPRRRIQDATG